MGWIEGYLTVGLLGVAAASIFTIWYYARRGTPIMVYIAGSLAMFFAFATVIILPVDLLERDELKPTLISAWRVVYWCSFTLNWAFVPIVQDYYNAGEFTFRGKLWFAIKANAKLYLAAGIIGVIILVSLYISKQTTDLAGLAMAMAQTAGFIVVVFLLGHGIVELPRSLWRKSNNTQMHNYYCFKVTKSHRKYQQAIAEWRQTLECVNRLADAIVEMPELHANFAIVRAGCLRAEDLDRNAEVAADRLPIFAQLEKKPYTQQTLVKLNRHCKQLTRRYTQVSGLRAGYINQAIQLESQMAKYEAQAATGVRRCRTGCNRWLKLGIAIVFTIIAFVLEFCEVTIPASQRLCPLSFMRNPIGFQIAAALIFFTLLWAMTCQLLFFMNVPRYYHVSPGHHTDETSLLYMAGNLLNVAAPLTYNFIALSKSEDTAFFTIIGKMKVVPFLGTGIHSGLPVFIALVSLLTLPHLLQRFFNCLPCLRAEEDDDEISLVDYGVYGDRDEESLIVREGQNLIRGFKRELQHRNNGDGSGGAPLNHDHDDHGEEEVELPDIHT